MIEDINAQAHQLLDTLSFKDGQIALSALRSLSGPGLGRGTFSSLLGIQMVFAEGGRAHCYLEVQPHMLNILGILHGGVAYSLADVTTGIAAASLLQGGQTVVTQDLHYRYHGRILHGRVDAEAHVIHKGTRTVVVHCALRQEARLIGTADGTFALLAAADLQK